MTTKTAVAQNPDELRKIRNIIKAMGGFILVTSPVGRDAYQVTYTRDPR